MLPRAGRVYSGCDELYWGGPKKEDVDVLNPSEESYNEGGGSLFNSQSTNSVSPLAVMYNTLFFIIIFLPHHLLSFFFPLFIYFIAKVNCQPLP